MSCNVHIWLRTPPLIHPLKVDVQHTRVLSKSIEKWIHMGPRAWRHCAFKYCQTNSLCNWKPIHAWKLVKFEYFDIAKQIACLKRVHIEITFALVYFQRITYCHSFDFTQGPKDWSTLFKEAVTAKLPFFPSKSPQKKSLSLLMGAKHCTSIVVPRWFNAILLSAFALLRFEIRVQ